MRTSTALFFLAATIVLQSCRSKIDEAYELKDLGLRDKAIELLNAQIAADPKNADAYFALGNIYAELGSREQALENYNNALKVDPENSRFRVHRVIAFVDEYTDNRLLFKGLAEQCLAKNPRDPLGLLLLTKSLIPSTPLDSTSVITYLDAMAKLNAAKPLHDWAMFYPDSARKVLEASYLFVKSGTAAVLSLDGKVVGQLAMNQGLNINRVSYDSAYYTDDHTFWLVSQTAYRIRSAHEGWPFWQTGVMQWNPLRLSYPDGLYKEAKCAHTEKDNQEWFRRFAGKQNYYLSELLDETPEPGSVTTTSVPFLYEASYSDGRQRQLKYEWEAVTYKKREHPTRKVALSENVLLFMGSNLATWYTYATSLKAERGFFENVLKAGLLAKNMTVEMVRFKVYGLSLKSREFNRDNFKLRYNDANGNEFTFTDGFLTEIALYTKTKTAASR